VGSSTTAFVGLASDQEFHNKEGFTTR